MYSYVIFWAQDWRCVIPNSGARVCDPNTGNLVLLLPGLDRRRNTTLCVSCDCRNPSCRYDDSTCWIRLMPYVAICFDFEQMLQTNLQTQHIEAKDQNNVRVVVHELPQSMFWRCHCRSTIGWPTLDGESGLGLFSAPLLMRSHPH